MKIRNYRFGKWDFEFVIGHDRCLGLWLENCKVYGFDFGIGLWWVRFQILYFAKEQLK